MSVVQWYTATGLCWHLSKRCAESRAPGWKATPLPDDEQHRRFYRACRVCVR